MSRFPSLSVTPTLWGLLALAAVMILPTAAQALGFSVTSITPASFNPTTGQTPGP